MLSKHHHIYAGDKLQTKWGVLYPWQKKTLIVEQQCKNNQCSLNKDDIQWALFRKLFACLCSSIYGKIKKRKKIILDSTMTWSYITWDCEQNVVQKKTPKTSIQVGFFFFSFCHLKCPGWSKNEVPPGCKSFSKFWKPLTKMSLLLTLSIRAEIAKGSYPDVFSLNLLQRLHTSSRHSVGMSAYCFLPGISFLSLDMHKLCVTYRT